MNDYFERHFKGPPFSENEDKKYEFCRLNSFTQWPKDSPVFPLKLAKAGFYFTGSGDEVVCYACGLKKDKWGSGDDPMDIHKDLNPTCPFVAEINSNNIPFQSGTEESPFTQRLNTLLESLEYSAAEAETSRASNSAVSEQNDRNRQQRAHGVSDQGLQQLTKSKQSQSNLPDSTVIGKTGATAKPDRKQTMDPTKTPPVTRSPSQNSDSSQGYDIPPPTGESIGPLRFERNRLETFKDWPPNVRVSAAELAKQGFHYTGKSDRVQCVFCKGILRNWETGDKPHIEHRKHFPRCPFVLGMKIGNVPLPLDLSGAQNRGNIVDSLSAGNTRGAAILGIVTDRPKHPQYAIESQRLASFQGWPPYKHQTPQQLAEAGFWYAGFNDNVKCFFCDGGLRNWDPGDDPWGEHARWFPRCPFVLQVKGQDFVNRILQENGGEIQIPGFTTSEGANQPNARAPTSTAKFNIEEREILARMDSPYVQKLISNNVDRGLIMRTLRRKLEQTGDDFPSCTALVEAVYALEAEEKANAQQTLQPPDASASGSSAQSQGRDIPGAGTSGLGEVGSQKGPAENILECSPSSSEDNPTNQQGSLSSNETNRSQDELLRENMELKEQRLCKICMTNEANVVFLPCGHLVSCAACAPALTLCPICRAPIKGSIRTYIV